MRVVQLALIHFESTLLKSMNSVETTQQWCHIFSIGKGGGGRSPFNCVALLGRYFNGANPGIVIQAAHIFCWQTTVKEVNRDIRYPNGA